MIRIQKVISQNSEYSRRKAEELIKEGKVKLNGEIIYEMGIKVSSSDEIMIDNQVIYEKEKVYYLLNKPKNIISSRTDDRGRDTITSLINEKNKIYPIGRLDFNTTGLIILTNDGELANLLMHPNQKIQKTYVAKVRGNLKKEEILKLKNGILLEGKKTLPAHIKIIKHSVKNQLSVVEISIIEGRNRQIKKMFESINGKVIDLKRIKYSFLTTENLPIGAYRKLKPKEIKKLYGEVL